MSVASVKCEHVTATSVADAILRLTVLYPSLDFSHSDNQIVADGSFESIDLQALRVAISDQVLRSTYSEQTAGLRTAMFNQLL